MSEPMSQDKISARRPDWPKVSENLPGRPMRVSCSMLLYPYLCCSASCENRSMAAASPLSGSSRRLLSGVALAGVMVALCARAAGGVREAVLFGGHDVDPSMPAPLIGGDDDAMPGGEGEWGGVGAGGTFLGRNMAKRRRIISDQEDLWKKAEDGIGNLVAMSKGEWVGRSGERSGEGRVGRSRGAFGSRHPPKERGTGSSDEEARSQSRDVRLKMGERERLGGRESELRQRWGGRAADERRGDSQDQTLTEAGDMRRRQPTQATGTTWRLCAAPSCA